MRKCELYDALEEAGDRLLLLAQCEQYDSLGYRVNMRIAKRISAIFAEVRAEAS